MLGKFTSLENAKNFLNRINKASAIILGDDNKYWVVTLSKMEELTKGGYESV